MSTPPQQEELSVPKRVRSEKSHRHNSCPRPVLRCWGPLLYGVMEPSLNVGAGSGRDALHNHGILIQYSTRVYFIPYPKYAVPRRNQEVGEDVDERPEAPPRRHHPLKLCVHRFSRLLDRVSSQQTHLRPARETKKKTPRMKKEQRLRCNTFDCTKGVARE